MRLGDVLFADRAVVPLQTTALDRAAEILLDRLIEAGAIEYPERLRERVAEHRGEDIVAMGERAFLLHYRTDAVTDLTVAVGTAPQNICRELAGGDVQCARIVLLIAAPPRLAAQYLQVVGAFARALSDQSVVEAVLAQPNAEELTRLPQFTDYKVPEQLAVRDIMTERPMTVRPETPLRDAAVRMVRAGVEGLPVVDEQGRLVGMLGERELLGLLLGSQLMGRTPPASASSRAVRDVMTRQVLCVSPDQPLADVASLMSNKDVDRVPVVREGRLVGVLTRGDIVRKLIGS